MEIDGGTVEGTDSEQIAEIPPAQPQQTVRKYNRKGGSKGAKKPSNLLKAMRWVSEHQPEKGEALSALRANCRQLQQEDLTEFMRQLAGLEKAHQSRKSTPPPSGGSSTGTSGSGSGGPSGSAPDRGEATTREMIDKLLSDFPKP